MSTKKVDRTEQKKNITAQIAKATQSVGVLTSQQDIVAPSRVETPVAESTTPVVAEEKTNSLIENTSTTVVPETVKTEVPSRIERPESASGVIEEKKTLRGAASPNYKRAKKEKVLISARIDKQMEEEIDRICEKENMSKTDILTFALDYVLNSYKMRKLILGRNSFIDNVVR